MWVYSERKEDKQSPENCWDESSQQLDDEEGQKTEMVRTCWKATVVLTESCVTIEIDATMLRGCPGKT